MRATLIAFAAALLIGGMSTLSAVKTLAARLHDAEARLASIEEAAEEARRSLPAAPWVGCQCTPTTGTEIPRCAE